MQPAAPAESTNAPALHKLQELAPDLANDPAWHWKQKLKPVVFVKYPSEHLEHVFWPG